MYEYPILGTGTVFLRRKNVGTIGDAGRNYSMLVVQMVVIQSTPPLETIHFQWYQGTWYDRE